MKRLMLPAHTTPLIELRSEFASDAPDYALMRRLAIIITQRMTDRETAAALHQEIEADIAISERARRRSLHVRTAGG